MLSFFRNEQKRTLLFLAVSAVSLALSFFNNAVLPVDAAWAAIILCGIPIIKNAVCAVITEFDIRADVLVSLALIASVITGEIFAAGEIAFIMTIGAYLEERTAAKARAGIEKLVSLSPSSARIVREGVEVIVTAEQVNAGDSIRVLAGETIPVDGVIVKGKTSIDQSVMTGESLPVDKAEGDEVLSGTVNQFGTFDMKALKTGEDSSLQRMIRLVEQADAGKAKIVRLADRWATWIVVIALVSAALTWFVSGEIIRAVTILVVFCPCALVLATPAAIMAGIGNAAKHGILVKAGDALERLSKIKRIAFDKTGTLTFGKPVVTKIAPCIHSLGEAELLKTAAAAELRSEHPLGKAIVARYKNEFTNYSIEPEDFELSAGRGVSALINGKRVFAGNENFLKEHGFELPQNAAADAALEKSRGATVIYIACEKNTLGFIALADTPRPGAAQTIKAIHAAGIKTVLLTGDSNEAAAHIANIAGISDLKSQCLPEDKLAAIQAYQKTGEAVCMVGDGINDAPALKTASVGIAMGGIGSDIAIEAAGIALAGDDIKTIPHLLLLSRRVMQTITVNLSASMALNFAAIILAVLGVLNPVLGALVHNAGSVAVIINSAFLLNWKSRKLSMPT
ncbi:MAG: cation-translocating P-type ATPase [Termitinemataceae bacterium]|nr:MAG: cation-translocating P-type ATPase [Termitinemataceae bacterium]